MATAVRFADVSEGDELPAQSFPVTRAALVAYCGASGDHNVIHWNQRIAQSVGLPDVIAHGMFTMAEAGRVVTDWVSDPGAVLEYDVRFSSPVVVPDTDEGTRLDVTGRVEKLGEDNQVTVVLEARVAGSAVLGKARAVVQLS